MHSLPLAAAALACLASASAVTAQPFGGEAPTSAAPPPAEAVALPPSLATAPANRHGGGFAELPAAMDRTTWSLPATSPTPAADLSLWSENTYAHAVHDAFEADPLAAESLPVSFEVALSTADR